jgi:uncharacterized delta-60 repeat protein
MKFLYLIITAAIFQLLSVSISAQQGQLDPTFNTTGYVINPVYNGDAVQKILVQPDQKILVVGMSFDPSYVSRAYAFRYLPDGTPDLSFGNNGFFTYELNFEANLYSAAITSGGKIVLAGSTTDYSIYEMLVIRLNEDGTLDSSFDTDGVLTLAFSQVETYGEDISLDMVLDGDDNIFLCGSSYDANYIRRPVIVKVTPAGVVDSTFGVDGVATIPVSEGACGFEGIMIQPDGKIVATGFFGNTVLWYTLLLVRFESDGTLDNTFSDDGIITYSYSNVDDEGFDLAYTADNNILVAGMTVNANYNYSALLMQFTNDGQLDVNFSDDGILVEDMDIYDYASNVRVLSDGDIVMAGTSGDGPPGEFDLAIWKYNSDGTAETTFGNNGMIQHQIGDHSTMIYGMDIQADNKIVIGGQARTPEVQNHFFVARIENELAINITEQEALMALVYPNPALVGSELFIQTSAPISSNATITMYTIDGRIVCSFNSSQCSSIAGGLGVKMPNSITPGLYFIEVKDNAMLVRTKITVAGN